ncbi:Cyanophycinase [compost metagenome]
MTVQKGHLVIIGGAEDRVGQKHVLKRVVELSGGKDAHMVVITTASSLGPEVEQVYVKAFGDLGVAKVTTLHIHDRKDANDPEIAEIVLNATGIFMTGGDQSRLASILGGSEVGKSMHRAYKRKGACVAGTSAGASAISDHMVGGGRNGIHPKKGMLNLIPGLGLLNRVIIDQHFSQRHRLGRLLSIIAQNPFMLGVGIDEDTAIVVDPETHFEVIGAGAVTIVDARHMAFCNVNEAKKNQILAMTDVKFHLLPTGYKFHIESRVPGKNEELVAEPPAPEAPIELKAKVKKAKAALKKASS